MCLYAFVFGQPPFRMGRGGIVEMFDAIKYTDPLAQLPSSASFECVTLLRELLEKDWKRRIVISEALRSRFVARASPHPERELQLSLLAPRERHSGRDVVQVTQAEIDDAHGSSRRIVIHRGWANARQKVRALNRVRRGSKAAGRPRRRARRRGGGGRGQARRRARGRAAPQRRGWAAACLVAPSSRSSRSCW